MVDYLEGLEYQKGSFSPPEEWSLGSLRSDSVLGIADGLETVSFSYRHAPFHSTVGERQEPVTLAGSKCHMTAIRPELPTGAPQAE